MKSFAHFNTSTVEEAVELLRRYGGKADLIAGGTDLLGKMKDRMLPRYPEALINLRKHAGVGKAERHAPPRSLSRAALINCMDAPDPAPDRGSPTVGQGNPF